MIMSDPNPWGGADHEGVTPDSNEFSEHERLLLFSAIGKEIDHHHRRGNTTRAKEYRALASKMAEIVYQ